MCLLKEYFDVFWFFLIFLASFLTFFFASFSSLLLKMPFQGCAYFMYTKIRKKSKRVAKITVNGKAHISVVIRQYASSSSGKVPIAPSISLCLAMTLEPKMCSWTLNIALSKIAFTLIFASIVRYQFWISSLTKPYFLHFLDFCIKFLVTKLMQKSGFNCT